MSTSKFQAALRKAQETKSVDQLLVGTSSNYLTEGVHEVVIQSLDTSKIEDEGINITYVGEGGKTHNERLFLMEYNGEEVSRAIRNLWASTVPDKEAIGKIIDEVMESNFEVFEMLTGMKLRITLGRGKKGFITKVNSEGLFAAYDVTSGEKLSDEYSSVKEAQEEAKAAGHKQNYVKVQRSEATNAEANLVAFDLAYEAKRKIKNSGGGSGSSYAGAGTGRTSLI